MTALDVQGVRRPLGVPATSVGRAALWVAVFLGGFVFYEPAPYELFLALAIPAWMIANPTIPRAITPLVVLMALFMAGGCLAASQANDMAAQPIYYAVSGFLALSACFFAAVLGKEPRMFDVVVHAWIAAALATVGLGLIGYFGYSGELFTRYQRASGGFEDPNVFGPFLVFPLAVLLRRAFTRPLGNALLNGTLALALLLGVFLSFSRAAWGLSVWAAVLTGLLLFVTERKPAMRARYVAMAVAGLVAVALVLAAALSVPKVASLFDERAQIVQEYDGGRLGRFERHAVGFRMMLERPLGIGALEFGKTLGEDEHDIWLKALTTYGWLGFAAYLVLVLWTIAAAFPLVFRTGPLQAVTQVAYVVFAGHILIATVIDIDHWRHVYLLFGVLWGAIAADTIARRRHLAELARPSAVAPLTGAPRLT